MELFGYITCSLLSVPNAAPQDIEIRLLNSTTAILRWRPPGQRDMNGDLKGFKVEEGSSLFVKLLHCWSRRS